MRITSVSVRKLVSGPGYNNLAIEAEATVEQGDLPERVRENLCDWVDQQIAHERSLEKIYEARREMYRTVGELENEQRQLTERVEKNRKVIREHTALRELAQAHNLDLPGLDDGLPF